MEKWKSRQRWIKLDFEISIYQYRISEINNGCRRNLILIEQTNQS